MIIDPYSFRPVRIAEIVREAPRAVSVRLELPEGYTFTVGQHAVIRVTMPDGTKLVRQYSFSASAESNELWFTIVQESDGVVSSWFVDGAKVGDIVEVSHPFSGPLMQKIPRGEICMIAGGSGIAPIMAWVRLLREQQRSFTLLYSTKNDERCFKNELTALPNETIVVRLTDKEPRFTEQEIIKTLLNDTTVFICGSRPFVLAMRSYCGTIVPSEHIFAEAFSL